MAEEFTVQETSVGEMHKRQEVMADGRRYIIYYTFGTEVPPADVPTDMAVEDTNEVARDV
jgi:hypothetical protein